MHPDHIMESDWLSRILLLGGFLAIVLALLTIVTGVLWFPVT